MLHPTTVSVGPYSLSNTVAGAWRRQYCNTSLRTASAPTTSVSTAVRRLKKLSR